MEGGHVPGQLTQVVAHLHAVAHQQGQSTLIRHPVHHQHVFTWRTVSTSHVSHPDIDVRGHTSVQGQLAVAGLAARLNTAEVQKAQVDRLLDLVRAVAQENNHG